MARKIVGTVFQSLDGVIQAPGGPQEDTTGGFALGGWQMGFPDEEAGQAIGESLKPPYSLLLGRRTYDIFAGYWPFHDGEDRAIADGFNAADKFVMSRGEGDLAWAGSERVAGFDELAAIGGGDGPDLQIWGSSTLYPGLLEHGLLDRLTVITYPLVLGQGKRLFGEGTPPTTLQLQSGHTTAKGVAIATFVPSPGIELSNSPPAHSNPTEDERQQKMAGETW